MENSPEPSSARSRTWGGRGSGGPYQPQSRPEAVAQPAYLPPQHPQLQVGGRQAPTQVEDEAGGCLGPHLQLQAQVRQCGPQGVCREGL